MRSTWEIVWPETFFQLHVELNFLSAFGITNGHGCHIRNLGDLADDGLYVTRSDVLARASDQVRRASPMKAERVGDAYASVGNQTHLMSRTRQAVWSATLRPQKSSTFCYVALA